MDDIPDWLQRVKELEAVIRGQYGASGIGLGQQIKNAWNQIPFDIRHGLRYVLRVRNHAVHDLEFDCVPADFVEVCDQLIELIARPPHAVSAAPPEDDEEYPDEYEPTEEELYGCELDWDDYG